MQVTDRDIDHESPLFVGVDRAAHEPALHQDDHEDRRHHHNHHVDDAKAVDDVDDVLVEIAQTAGLDPLLDLLGGLDGTMREGGRNLKPGDRVGIFLVRLHLIRPRLIPVDGDCDLAARHRIDSYLAARPSTVIERAQRHTPLMRVV